MYRAIRNAGKGFKPSRYKRGSHALNSNATAHMSAVGTVCSQASGERGLSGMKLRLALGEDNSGNSAISKQAAQPVGNSELKPSAFPEFVKIWGRYQCNLSALVSFPTE